MDNIEGLTNQIILPSDIVTPVWFRLKSDPLLIDSIYLGSNDCFFKFSATENSSVPRVIISAEPLFTDPDTQWTSFGVDIEIVLANIKKSMAMDLIRFDLVSRRIAAILVGNRKLLFTGYAMYDVILQHVSRPEVSKFSKLEAMQVLRFQVDGRTD